MHLERPVESSTTVLIPVRSELEFTCESQCHELWVILTLNFKDFDIPDRATGSADRRKRVIHDLEVSNGVHLLERKHEIVEPLHLFSEDNRVPNKHLDLCLSPIRAVALLLQYEHEVVVAVFVLLQVGPEFERIRRLVEADEVRIIFARDLFDAVFPNRGTWAIWNIG